MVSATTLSSRILDERVPGGGGSTLAGAAGSSEVGVGSVSALIPIPPLDAAKPLERSTPVCFVQLQDGGVIVIFAP